MPRSKPYRLHSQAWLEIEAADSWYRQHSPDISAEFVEEVFAAIRSIRDAPTRWPAYLFGTRRLVLDRFPFSIVYLDSSELVNIVAVAHSKRRPGYWQRRL